MSVSSFLLLISLTFYPDPAIKNRPLRSRIKLKKQNGITSLIELGKLCTCTISCDLIPTQNVKIHVRLYVALVIPSSQGFQMLEIM